MGRSRGESPLAALAAAKIVDLTVNDVADRYEVGDMLGEGRFSKVHLGTQSALLLRLAVLIM